MWDVMQDKQLLICVSLARGGQKELCKKKNASKGKCVEFLGKGIRGQLAFPLQLAASSRTLKRKGPFILFDAQCYNVLEPLRNSALGSADQERHTRDVQIQIGQISGIQPDFLHFSCGINIRQQRHSSYTFIYFPPIPQRQTLIQVHFYICSSTKCPGGAFITHCGGK